METLVYMYIVTLIFVIVMTIILTFINNEKIKVIGKFFRKVIPAIPITDIIGLLKG